MTADNQTGTDLMPASWLSRAVARAIDAAVVAMITTTAFTAGLVAQWNSDDPYRPGGYGWLTLGTAIGRSYSGW